MIEYRRIKGRDVWHWIPTCSHWPADTKSFTSRPRKPTTGELCNQCRAKARKK